MARPHSRQRQQGSVLVIIAAILVAVGLISAATAVKRNAEVKSQRASSANVNLDGVAEAIFAYGRTARRLPCPDTNGDGIAETTCTDSSDPGSVPWATVGISRRKATDPWGQAIGYRVRGAITAESALLDPTTTTNYGLSVCTNTASPCSFSHQVDTDSAAAFVLISFGPTGPTRTSDGAERTNREQSPQVAGNTYYRIPASASFDDVVLAKYTVPQMVLTTPTKDPGGGTDPGGPDPDADFDGSVLSRNGISASMGTDNASRSINTNNVKLDGVTIDGSDDITIGDKKTADDVELGVSANGSSNATLDPGETLTFTLEQDYTQLAIGFSEYERGDYTIGSGKNKADRTYYDTAIVTLLDKDDVVVGTKELSHSNCLSATTKVRFDPIRFADGSDYKVFRKVKVEPKALSTDEQNANGNTEINSFYIAGLRSCGSNVTCELSTTLSDCTVP